MHIKEIIILVVVTFLGFSLCLSGDFIGDDEVLFVKNTFYRSPQNFTLFSKDYLTKSEELYLHPDPNLGSGSIAYRPVLSATFFLDHLIWKLNPMGYHLTNVLLHVANVVLVYLLVFMIMGDKKVAFLSSLLFGLHPAKVEAIASIGYRADVLCGFFVLCSIIFFLKYRRTTSCFCHGIKKIKYYFLSLIGYFLALFTKEAAIILPAILIVYDSFYDERDEGLLKKLFSPVYFSYAVVAIFYLIVYLKIFPNSTLQGIQLLGGSLASHIQTVFWIFALYLKDLLLPFKMTMIPPLYAPSVELYSVYKLIFGAALLVLMIGGIFCFEEKKKEVSFFLVFFLVAILPVSNIIPIANPMAHRFLYIPSIGLLIAMGILLSQFSERLSKIKIMASSGLMLRLFIVFLFTIVTVGLSASWRTNHTVAERLIEDHPQNRKGYSILGEYQYKRGKYSEAKRAFKKAISLGSKNPRDFYMLGMSSLDNYSEAQRYLLAAMSNNDEYVAPLVGLGRFYFLNKKYDKAKIFLRKAVSIKPAYASCGYLIQIYMIQGKMADAYKVLGKAENVIVEKEELESLKKIITRSGKYYQPVDIGI